MNIEEQLDIYNKHMDIIINKAKIEYHDSVAKEVDRIDMSRYARCMIDMLHNYVEMMYNRNKVFEEFKYNFGREFLVKLISHPYVYHQDIESDEPRLVKLISTIRITSHNDKYDIDFVELRVANVDNPKNHFATMSKYKTQFFVRHLFEAIMQLDPALYEQLKLTSV